MKCTGYYFCVTENFYYTVDSLYFVGFQFSWITLVVQSTNLKLQQNIIYVLHSFLDKAKPRILSTNDLSEAQI